MLYHPWWKVAFSFMPDSFAYEKERSYHFSPLYAKQLLNKHALLEMGILFTYIRAPYIHELNDNVSKVLPYLLG